ncbi:CAMK protein kinase [Cryptococcus wingfieldii CBS 7118]|uniref:CAMK protein kinase n=1 Tax=Cryptococcus wingfieldii CBS 7118 TaxID=1295528 RepID=A0A1E3IHT8_9TREE|nr:CAMK protein kinase [Cryptococcus wingfieldii CBS 7118]ODN88098.1 CAMK protein kinase [Cryptococcus wingfieldii CBS 7118]
MPTSKSSIDHRDVYYRKAKSAGYRARSAYKLLHLSEEFDLFTGVETAVDLCAAPGSWTQVLGNELKPSGKGEAGRKVVSVDLQTMAPLPNITILQTDITLPSTIPLVLDALGGRKADLVVCDGAPDVTGVHDLDAYLHSQLLLAALTLSLTLLAPHATLIFKIFLSPLDPKAEFLASQLRCFFPGPSLSSEQPDEVIGEFGEFDEEGETGAAPGVRRKGVEGYDLEGRRGGVWVRKPRSSRQGSGEAFVVCRNFSPSAIPLPTIFSPEALQELRQQTSGTLTLDSLATLGLGGEGVKAGKEWEIIKGYVGGGDLDAMSVQKPSLKVKAPPVRLQLPDPSPIAELSVHSPISPAVSSPLALHAHPTPLDGSPEEYFSPKETHFPSHITGRPETPNGGMFLSPKKSKLSEGVSGGRARGVSDVGSVRELTPNPSPVRLVDPTRPWASSSHQSGDGPVRPPSVPVKSSSMPVPSPSPPISDPASASLAVPSRYRALSSASARSHGPPGPLVSPSLSTGSSRTDLFFASSAAALPTPPKKLDYSVSAVGKGLPSGTSGRNERSSTMPSTVPVKLRLPPRKEKFKDPSPASVEPIGWASTGAVEFKDPSTSLEGVGAPAKLGFEEISTSRLRSLSNPTPLQGQLAVPSIPPPLPHHGSSSSSSGGSQSTPTPTPGPSTPSKSNGGKVLRRKESQVLEREQRHSTRADLVKEGSVIRPTEKGKRGWKVVRKLGEGAFSGVWSAIPESSSPSEKEGQVQAALKLMPHHLSLLDSRTRIAFLREVEVLRHIHHPSIVRYLDSFSTPGWDVLVLERLDGGELFGWVSDEATRERMILPAPEPEPGSLEEWDKDGEGLIRRIFSELAKAVGWLHEVGVVHRDIKLENILFTTNPFELPPTSTNSVPLRLLPPPNQPLIKLTDFGLSRFISPASPLLATRCGSESFAAPEIIMAKPYDGRQTDAWAMGVVLYGMVVGELPFDREEAEGMTTPGSRMTEKERWRKKWMRIAKGAYTWPTRDPVQSPTNPGADAPGTGTPALRSIVAALLEREPSRRAKPLDLWDQQPWMAGPGGVGKPEEHAKGCECGKGVLGETQVRRILDGFLVEEDGIEEVARAEHY